MRVGIWGRGLADEEEEGEVGCEVEGVLGVGGGHSVAFSYGFCLRGRRGRGVGLAFCCLFVVLLLDFFSSSFSFLIFF